MRSLWCLLGIHCYTLLHRAKVEVMEPTPLPTAGDVVVPEGATADDKAMAKKIEKALTKADFIRNLGQVVKV